MNDIIVKGRFMIASITDISKLAKLLIQLWPHKTLEESEKVIKHYLQGATKAVLTRNIDGQYVGLALCSLRSDYVEGCDSSPVGYLEGIVVDEKYRMKGIAYSLRQECEAWAKSKGCKEFVSDCELTNTDSLTFHLNIGFKEENRKICFKKNL